MRLLNRIISSLTAVLFLSSLLGAVSPQNAKNHSVQAEQAETSSSPESFAWVGHGRIEGHLALWFSPDGAFAPDSSGLAFADGSKIVMVNLATSNISKVLSPKLAQLRDLDIQSVNYLAADRLLILGNGVVLAKGKQARPTPMLAFQWDISRNARVGRIDVLGKGGGFGRPRYFPQIGYLGMYKDSSFTFWNPAFQKGGTAKIPDLKRKPSLYTLAPDGHWLLLAQIAASGNPNPIVVRLSEHKFVDSLAGHGGPVLGMAFSRDSSKVVTACADGKVRIWSAPGWKLLQTLSGNEGPVHWAEFSPDGKWVASAGQDHTVRIWSVASGKLVQTLRESTAPLLTVGFSPNGSYLAASTEHNVFIWQKTPTGP